MKTRTALSLASAVVLAPLMTGCLFTHALDDKLNATTVDSFNPSAVYRGPKTNSFALEGTRRNQKETFHAFLMIPEDVLEAAQLQARENLSLEDIRKLRFGLGVNPLAAAEFRKDPNLSREQIQFYRFGLGLDFPPKTRGTIPPGYERIAVLPKNDINLEIQLHGTGWPWCNVARYSVDLF